MNARYGVFLIVVACCLLSFQTGLAFEKVGTAGYTFLEIPVGARQTAMGEAAIALDDLGALGIFWNPASLGFIDGPVAGVAYTSWIVDISQTGVAFGLPIVSTKIGARGMDVGNEKELIVCDLKDFKENINKLFNNKKKCNELRESASRYVQKYDWKKIGLKVSKILDDL